MIVVPEHVLDVGVQHAGVPDRLLLAVENRYFQLLLARFDGLVGQLFD